MARDMQLPAMQFLKNLAFPTGDRTNGVLVDISKVCLMGEGIRLTFLSFFQKGLWYR